MPPVQPGRYQSLLAADRTYPVRFAIDYPEGPRNRLTVFLRIILALPILAIVMLIDGSIPLGQLDPYWTFAELELLLMGIGLHLATTLMILFRRKYPRWWFDWNLQVTRFTARIAVYLFLLRDDYPSTDERQAVTLDIEYPDANDLNRVLPLFKWVLAIPHYAVLFVLGLAGAAVTVLGWFAVLITGELPRWMFRYLEGLMRWWVRIGAYAFLLTTDRYPPFRLGE